MFALDWDEHRATMKRTKRASIQYRIKGYSLLFLALIVIFGGLWIRVGMIAFPMKIVIGIGICSLGYGGINALVIHRRLRLFVKEADKRVTEPVASDSHGL